MPSPFKVHELLSRDELTELEAFAREPARSVDECHDWLMARGFTLARSSVGRWLREFRLTDRFAASNEAARALVDAARAGGTVAITDAAALNLSQLIFEQMSRIGDSAEPMDTKELWGLSMALKNVIQGKRHVEKLRGEIKTAVEEAEKAAKSGASGEAVIAKVREILGAKS